MIEWWCYRHINGTFHLKRYFSPLDIQEGRESPFVDSVYGPFQCNKYEDAQNIMREKLSRIR
jgi:hypothetical protein